MSPANKVVIHWQGGVPEKADAWSAGSDIQVEAYLNSRCTRRAGRNRARSRAGVIVCLGATRKSELLQHGCCPARGPKPRASRQQSRPANCQEARKEHQPHGAAARHTHTPRCRRTHLALAGNSMRHMSRNEQQIGLSRPHTTSETNKVDSPRSRATRIAVLAA
jgi:hypothetical protein